MKRIKEIVIVEGKTDTQLLKELYDVDTIETHGLALNDKTLELIKEASLTRGVIVLTDPDYPGLKIRNQVDQVVDNLYIGHSNPCILPQVLSNRVHIVIDYNCYSFTWHFLFS